LEHLLQQFNNDKIGDNYPISQNISTNF